MAARLSLDERVFIESSLGAGRSVADVAQRLGRDRSTVHRELARCAGRAGYDARWAHASACARARRERTPKLAVDRVLAAAVDERLRLRWSPHATAADLREAGMSVCAQTIYRACYANDARSGPPAGSWAKLPRRCRRRRPRCVAQAQKPSPLGEYRPIADRPDDVEDRSQPGHWDRDLIVGKANLTAAVTLAERTSRYTVTAALPDGYGAPQVAAAVTAALGRSARAQPHLGPRPRHGPLGRRRGRARHRGVLLRAALAVAATHQRAHQRTAAPMAPQRHQPRHRAAAALGHRGQPQPHAPPTPPLGISTRHLHSTHLQPPVELALVTLACCVSMVGGEGAAMPNTVMNGVVAVSPGSEMYEAAISLGDANSRTLGHMPYAAFEQAAREGRLVVHVVDEEVLGYALFSRRVRTHDLSLTHLCVDERQRGSGTARVLVEHLVATHPNHFGLRLSCRNDYPAHNMWPRLGFTPLGPKRGRSKAGHPLTVWWREISAMSLFDETLGSFGAADGHDGIVVALASDIAGHIAAGRDDPDVMALTADWVADLADLAVTAGTQAELDGGGDDDFRVLGSSPQEASRYLHRLRSDTELDDIPDLVLVDIAEAAGGGAHRLVTQDPTVLSAAEAITAATGVRVGTPEEILTLLDAHGGELGYRPEVVSTSRYVPARAAALPSDDELGQLRLDPTDETVEQLRGKLADVVERGGYVDEVRTGDGRLLSVAAHLHEERGIAVDVLRSAAGPDRYSLLRQAIHGLREVAVRIGAAAVHVDDDFDTLTARCLRDEGFKWTENAWTAHVRHRSAVTRRRTSRQWSDSQMG